MGPQDDPEAFLTFFEQVAETSGCPMKQRAARLLPLLTGEEQLAVLQLPANRRLAYVYLHRAILQRVGHTPEQQRQRFRALRLEEVGRPFTFGQQVRDACGRWLRADNRDTEVIIDQVALEQFIVRLPAGGAEWVQCHRPASLDQAFELAEDHLAAVPMTDVSDRGLGAVLSQEVEGEDRPVLYISQKLSVHEGRYRTIEKECLAIKWTVLALRYYLLGRPFTLCSDHAPLQWLHRMKDANARITRWYLALQPFNFKVVHRPGAQMVMADFLSRRGGGFGSRLWSGRLPGLSWAMGVCGSGGVVKRRSVTGGWSQGR
ncbi:uncharacterized protein LOC132890379 [Neoarius graeffei]|uniref:uncharacterized protein LOC132890379 n=1 Tax=Neoarius graeffei TaxID=443677 RepID=UPI00298CD27A|nr:uncharacterized protein LOC132890379 [Neoarius graeffei]